jgi:hypothetical protein
MKVLTFAAGLAAGYVLGTRAGREKFDQIVTSARKMGNHPTVVQAQDKVKDMLSSDTGRQSTPSTTPAVPTAPSTDSTTVPAASTGRAKNTTTLASGGAPTPLTQ